MRTTTGQEGLFLSVAHDIANGDSHSIENQSLAHSDDIDSVLGGNGISPGARLVHRQTFHDYEQLQKQYAHAPETAHRDLQSVQRSWWWPLGRHRSAEPSPQPPQPAIPIITTTQPSQRPSISHTGGPNPQSRIMTTSHTPGIPNSPSPKSPVTNSNLPTPLTSKFSAIQPPTIVPTVPLKRDGSGSAIHPSIYEVLGPTIPTSPLSALKSSSSSQNHGADSATHDHRSQSKTPPAITRAANPYHHAPASPRDLHSAD